MSKTKVNPCSAVRRRNSDPMHTPSSSTLWLLARDIAIKKPTQKGVVVAIERIACMEREMDALKSALMIARKDTP